MRFTFFVLGLIFAPRHSEECHSHGISTVLILILAFALSTMLVVSNTLQLVWSTSSDRDQYLDTSAAAKGVL